MFKFLKKLMPVDTARNEVLIAEYWEKRRIEKIEEKKFTTHSPEHNADHIGRVKNDLDSMGATNFMIISTGKAPRLTFDLNGVNYITSYIYNMDYDIIMDDVKKLLNKK